jgi:hypothetical protein
LVNTPKRPALGVIMPQKFINVGNQSNDGTGDSIREAFSKVNNNFADIYDFLEQPTGFRFASLEDFPQGSNTASNVYISDPLLKLGPGGQIVATEQVTISGTTSTAIVMKDILAGQGMTITNTENSITIENSTSRLVTDSNPTLSNNLIGTFGTATFRATLFANPIADQDLVTRKFVYDNFLNRDGTTISGSEASTATIFGGSRLRENISLTPSTQTVYSTVTNFGKVITVIGVDGSFVTVDLTKQATSSTHLTRKDYVDTKISLQGTNTIDPKTGEVNPGFGKMTGPLILSRDPITDDDFAPFSGKIAATKAYVDRNDFFSDNNLFVTTKGSDYQPLIPPIRRGRAPQYAFATLNKAARYAEQLIATSRIQVGDYARLITFDNGTPATVFDATENFYGNNLARLRLEVGINGSDQIGAAATGEFKIFPGQYIQGVESGAIALIENIIKATVPGDPESYSIAYVDYADDFDTRLIIDSNTGNPNRVLMIFEDDQFVPIPDFWVGYKFYTDAGLDNGVVISVGSSVDNAGVYTNSFLVEFPPGNAPGDGVIEGPDWHVYANDFQEGETVVYNTNVSALQISFIIESGEYVEQYPIKLPANTSIRGDEFRRVIIRPAAGVSSSPWAGIHFRRDAQIDGLQTAALNTSTNYAVSLASVSPSASSGVISLSLSSGAFASNVKGYIFVGNGGQGIIETVNGGIFTVNLGIPLLDDSEILSGDWAVYEPIVFGRHYLKNPNLPQNNLTTTTNAGGYYNAALELQANKSFIQEETVAWLNDQIANNAVIGSVDFSGYSFDEDLCRRDADTIVDSLVFDLTQGGSGKIIAFADVASTVPSLTTGQNSLSIDRISEVAQSIILGIPVVASPGNSEIIVTSVLDLEAGADGVVADLLQAASRIINLDPDYNPAKNNSELDVFLCNDANVLRYISCQNHGGFMQVLDPVGQIKNKSPYTQTASSFSQSKEKQVFAGGMFVDGFSGNVTATVVDFVSDPLALEVTGLRRRPQVPTFFMHRGIRYQVSFFADFAPAYITTSTNNVVEQFYSATLKLNPLNPGGITNDIIVTDDVGGFAPSSIIPILVEQPSGIGGLTATGYAVSTSTGFITDIVIDFPGTGYISTPFISVGGAIFNNLSFSAGGVNGLNIVTGGSGYTVGTLFEIIPIGVLGGVKATGTVATVNASGGITSVTFVTNGSGWNSSVNYRVAFGDLNINVPAPTPGFIDLDNVPDSIEMVTAGNRSMLANDFTQINDLGYAIFCTNGSYMENVSMFTYYCYRSYFALNGAQIRTTTGSTCYGEYGLVADGSDPMEVPIPVTLPLPLVQIATAYVSNPLFPAQLGQTSIYVEIDPLNGGYPPLNDCVIEINHNGIRKNYSVGSAGPALDSGNVIIPNVYQLLFNTGNIAAGNDNVGLITEVNNGDSVIIRVGGLVKLLGFNPNSITRPATSLTWNDDPTEIYFVTEFSPIQPDNSVLTYTASEYNYITFQTVPQGILTPTLVFGGTGYTTSTTVNIGTGAQLPGTTAVVNGDQGVGTIGIQTITVSGITNIVPGHVVTGTNILSGSYVTFVDIPESVICINQPTSGPISSGTVLTFTAVAPVVTLTITTGTITDIVVSNGGTGWYLPSTSVSIVGTGAGATVVSPVGISGVTGSTVIKITSLDLISVNRINAGISASPPQYYQFALGDQIYEITGYRSSIDLNAAWAEIDINPPLGETISQGIILKAGVPANSRGSLTTKISILRATSHDFVLIGTGGYATTRYPNDLYGPPLQQPLTSREVVESNRGRVFYVSTDQDGNFRVGRALTVNQNKGSVNISVPLDLSNLSSVSLRRDLGPPINEFSIDGTMVTEADFKVPTEQAVVTYLNRRLGIDRNGSVYPGSPLGPQFMALSGVLPMKGAIDMASFRIANLASPRSGFSTDAANKGYTDTKLSNKGTASLDVNNITYRPEWGRMLGSLQLFNDPVIKTATVATTATIGASNITFTTLTSAGNYAPGDFLRHRIIGAGIPDGTYVGTIGSDGLTLGLSDINEVGVVTTGTISPGTVISFDPVFQAATKRVVDQNRQFNRLVDVSLNGQTDRDFVMFSDVVIAANSTTNPPVYTTATQIINVANNNTSPLNTPTSSAGGSDITVTRANNTITFKLVGGTANDATNPITDRHINSFAQIKQAKLLMNTATTQVAPTVGTQTQIQATLGLANFDSRMFTATSGWVTLVDSTGTTSGVQTAKQAWVPAPGGFLGATNTAAATAASYVSSATMKVWLQNESTDWRYSANLVPNVDISEDLGTSGLRWGNIFASTATLDGGLVLNTLARIGTNQTTAEIFTATVTTLNAFNAATTISLGRSATTFAIGTTTGVLTISNPTVVGTEATQNLYNTVATTMNFAGAATTVNLGAGSGLLNLNNTTITASSATTFNMNGASPSIVTSNAGTASLFNTNALTGNLFGAATAVTIGATSGTLNLRNATITAANATTVNLSTATIMNMNGASPSIVTSDTGSASLFNTNALTGNLFGAATTITIGAASGTANIRNATLTMANGTTFNMNGTNPSIVTSNAGTASLFNTNAVTGNLFGAATAVTIGAASGTLTLRNTTIVGTQASLTLFDSVATTLNFAGAATTLNIGNASGRNTILGTTVITTLSATNVGSTVSGAWTLAPGATFEASYADLAEWYGSDAEYDPGTVLIFGGESEVTLTTLSSDSRVAGVVTTNPAYIMNGEQAGTRACIALQGRVPVKVVGIVRKGDLLTTSSTPGYAIKAMNPTVGTIIGKALEDKDDPGMGTIQVAIGRM